jgi:hypothetical protein
MAKNKNSSPIGGKRACLCKNGTYSSECCDGKLESQGIGPLEGQEVSTVVNTNQTRTIVNTSN